MTLKDIEKDYYLIESVGNYRLYEHNKRGEELIILVDLIRSRYCYTSENITYTIRNDDEFNWYELKKAL